MIDVTFNNNFDIVSNNQIQFTQNNNLQKWKVLLTAPKGSFYRDPQLGVDYSLLIKNARLNNKNVLISYYRNYANNNSIDLLDISFGYDSQNNALIITFYFFFTSFQSTIST